MENIFDKDFSFVTGQEIKKVIKKKRKDIPAEEKKICLWVLDDGTACGKTFTKFDSLKRHVSEAHKGVRPFACTLCGKNYGRRDYLLRHLKSHNEAEVSSISAQRFLGSNNQVVSSKLEFVRAKNSKFPRIFNNFFLFWFLSTFNVQ